MLQGMTHFLTRVSLGLLMLLLWRPARGADRYTVHSLALTKVYLHAHLALNPRTLLQSVI